MFLDIHFECTKCVKLAEVSHLYGWPWRKSQIVHIDLNIYDQIFNTLFDLEYWYCFSKPNVRFAFWSWLLLLIFKGWFTTCSPDTNLAINILNKISWFIVPVPNIASKCVNGLQGHNTSLGYVYDEQLMFLLLKKYRPNSPQHHLLDITCWYCKRICLPSCKPYPMLFYCTCRSRHYVLEYYLTWLKLFPWSWWRTLQSEHLLHVNTRSSASLFERFIPRHSWWNQPQQLPQEIHFIFWNIEVQKGILFSLLSCPVSGINISQMITKKKRLIIFGKIIIWSHQT